MEIWHYSCICYTEGYTMSNPLHQCCVPGCGTLAPLELQSEGFCVSHFLSSAEKACSEMRREAATGESSAARRAELESYVAAAAMKLALIGTGSARLSDEIKKRVLTTFLTLMILRENLDRPINPFLPRSRTPRTQATAA
jgi:hypothetical protein